MTIIALVITMLILILDAMLTSTMSTSKPGYRLSIQTPCNGFSSRLLPRHHIPTLYKVFAAYPRPP